MGYTLRLTQDQVMEDLLVSEDTKKIDEWATKHDCHIESYVFKQDDTYYRFNLEYSYNNGVVSFDYGDTIVAYEVEPVEVTIIEWRKVK